MAVQKAAHSGVMAPSTLLRSRKMIAPFAVHAPTTVAEAIALKMASPTAAYMAGGIEIADRLKYGLPCSDLIRLDRIPQLTTIGLDGGHLRIGAAIPHRVIAADPLLGRYLPGFREAVARIGSPRIRSQGTIGGNLMCGVAHYDILPMLIALSGQLVFGEADGTLRECDAEGGLPDDPSALLVSISIPVDEHCTLSFERIDKPVLSLAVALSAPPDRSASARAVLACPGQMPFLRTFDIASASDTAIAALAASWCASLPDSPDGQNASAWYRNELSQVRLRRLLTRMLGASR